MAKRDALVLCLAAAGGVAGHFVFFLLAAHGLYGLAIPGGFVGLGAGILKNRSLSVAVISAALALAAGVVTQYRFMPLALTGGFAQFLGHLFELPPLTLFMLAVGAFAGFWVPFRRS